MKVEYDWVKAGIDLQGETVFNVFRREHRKDGEFTTQIGTNCREDVVRVLIDGWKAGDREPQT